MAARYLLGADRSSVLSWVMATGSVTSGCRLSPAPHTEAHGGTRGRGSYVDSRYKTNTYIGHFKNPLLVNF